MSKDDLLLENLEGNIRSHIIGHPLYIMGTNSIAVICAKVLPSQKR